MTAALCCTFHMQLGMAYTAVAGRVNEPKRHTEYCVTVPCSVSTHIHVPYLAPLGRLAVHQLPFLGGSHCRQSVTRVATVL